MNKPELNESIDQAKKYLRENWHKGCECPACGQLVKLYKRNLSATPARGLIELYKLDQIKPGYHHIREIESQERSHGGDFGKMVYWGLIVQLENNDTKKRTSGMWAITDKGKRFVRGLIAVPQKVLIFNAKYFGYDGPNITIEMALGKHFDYAELMADYYEPNNQASLL